MATIFLSYRRTDSPQACRVYDWLGQRFGHDSIFMDVAAIPFAVSFPDFIEQAIVNSKVLIALIGTQWQTKIHDTDDPVRMEIEVAIDNSIPVLPILIGNTPMPDVDELPASILTIASQNAVNVGVLHDFNTHMQSLLPKVESILGVLAMQSVVTSDPYMIQHACTAIIKYLEEEYYQSTDMEIIHDIQWRIAGTVKFIEYENQYDEFVTLRLHRIARLAELVELHFILSFWVRNPDSEHLLAGWVMSQLEKTPIIPDELFWPDEKPPVCDLKIRRSDEDARQVWKMITDAPLRLSLTYVATISPKRHNL